jgi:hypothetical protein
MRTVEPLADFRLRATFEGGEKREYDIKPLIAKWEAFTALSYIKGLFERVKVAAGGYGVVWNDDIDLAGEEIYMNGRPL